MKKLLSTAALMAVFILPAHIDHAQAQEINFKPYVGFDLQKSVYNYNNNYDIRGGPHSSDQFAADLRFYPLWFRLLAYPYGVPHDLATVFRTNY